MPGGRPCNWRGAIQLSRPYQSNTRAFAEEYALQTRRASSAGAAAGGHAIVAASVGVGVRCSADAAMSRLSTARLTLSLALSERRPVRDDCERDAHGSHMSVIGPLADRAQAPSERPSHAQAAPRSEPRTMSSARRAAGWSAQMKMRQTRSVRCVYASEYPRS
jgi:hypothetical protein